MDHKQLFRRILSYVLVAVLASAVTWAVASFVPSSKLEQISMLIENRYIGESDKAALEDTAAAAMVRALPDNWSTYIPAGSYKAHRNNQNNEYVGIGVTIYKDESGGFYVLEVNPKGPAAEAGVCPGDVITHVDGQDVTVDEVPDLQNFIPGKVGTKVTLTLRRGEESLELTVKRKMIHQEAVTGQMLEGNIGLVTIANFHKEAGQESIDQVKQLVEQGAEKLIFDVRGNPGGFVDELNELLDYLLPEGPLFRSVNYKGNETVDRSDASCLELPMAVLINGNSYSAAEFFAAALSEYEWAITVGEPTTGKGYFQNTLELMDGSALYLSVGKYFTPNGVSLADVGGLVPDVPVEPASGVVDAAEDPQIQAAIKALAE